MTPTPINPAIKNARRVDLDDPEELHAWCLHFALSEANLRTAIGAVGPMSAAIHTYINSRGRRDRARGRQTGELGPPFARRSPDDRVVPAADDVPGSEAAPSLSLKDGVYEVTLKVGGVATQGIATVRNGVLLGFDTLQGVGGTIVVDTEPVRPS